MIDQTELFAQAQKTFLEAFPEKDVMQYEKFLRQAIDRYRQHIGESETILNKQVVIHQNGATVIGVCTNIDVPFIWLTSAKIIKDHVRPEVAIKLEGWQNKTFTNLRLVLGTVTGITIYE